jgi:hypothetical protein
MVETKTIVGQTGLGSNDLCQVTSPLQLQCPHQQKKPGAVAEMVTEVALSFQWELGLDHRR